MELYEIETWAGPAWDELNSDQRDRLTRVADDVAARYPDIDDQPLRDAALSAAVQYMLGETTLTAAGEELRRARRQVDLVTAAARQLAILADDDGMSQSQIATDLGVQRAKTLRSWIGKA